ncbi:MAG TPA: class I adenylate-forming enzyme family protein, partial [Quisquiliibacterium sp.]|nr:class I adenylate-forming enzyme family protein [Quisquiliibacterium sp.]
MEQPLSARASNVTQGLALHARSSPGAPALLTPDREIGYGELDALVWKSAGYLHRHGVRPGHVVALACVDELASVLCLLAIARLGATVFSIPRSATPYQRAELASLAGIDFLASDRPERFDAGLPFVPADRQELTRDAPPVDPGIFCEAPLAPWLLISGSGTTGRPKLIPVTHAQEHARASLASSWLGLGPADRVASLSHFDFAHPKHRLLEVLNAGASFGLPRADEVYPVRLCRDMSITVLHMTVFHAEALLAGLPAGGGHALPGLRALTIGASTVGDGLRERIRRRLCPNLIVRYATNESGPVCVAGPPEVFAVPGTVGAPLPGVQVQVVDGALRPLPPDVAGLIRIRGAGVVDGYRGDDEATRRAFRDGWFLPGDLGRLTRDGAQVHLGRADQLMIVNGINIYPAEIERAMATHPAVRDVVAMPVPHAVHQDVPVCAVALHQGMEASEQELQRHARERLGPRSPTRVFVFDEIPRSERGKPIRAELGRRIARRLGQRSAGT